MSKGGQPVFRRPLPHRGNPERRAIKALAVKGLVSIGQWTSKALAVESLVHLQGELSRAFPGVEQFNALSRR